MRLSAAEQKTLIPDNAIKAAFLRREDVARLPPAEQEKLWQEHLVKVNKFREMISGVESIIV